MGGTERHLADLLARLDRKRFDVHVFSLEASHRLQELAAFCSSKVASVNRLTDPRTLAEILRLSDYLRGRRIDVVQTFLFKASVIAVLAARWVRCPVVITSRRNLGYWHTPAFLRVVRFLNRFTTRVLANSLAVKGHTERTERLAPEKVDVIYNGVDLARYSPGCGDPAVAASIGIPPTSPLVGVVANLRPVKNLPLFLRAAALVAEAVPEARFVLVGSGPLRHELGQLGEELDLAGKVFFSDERGDVPDYLARLSIGCLPSLSEGFPNSVLEYMAAGLPVVATDAGGTAEAVEHGVTGYLVRNPDPSAFAEPVIQLLKDEAKRRAMGQRSLERCRNHFSLERSVCAHEDYYISLLSQHVR